MLCQVDDQRFVIITERGLFMTFRFIFLLPILMLPACATIVKGSTQDITVTSTPDHASCQVMRGASQTAMIESTPGIVKLNRGSEDTIVSCVKPGFDRNAVTMVSAFNGATFGNLLVGGIVGIIVDASTGANYTYQDRVNVVLSPNGPMMQVAPSVGAYAPGEPIRLQPTQPGV
jgi:hypothetical protein